MTKTIDLSMYIHTIRNGVITVSTGAYFESRQEQLPAHECEVRVTSGSENGAYARCIIRLPEAIAVMKGLIPDPQAAISTPGLQKIKSTAMDQKVAALKAASVPKKVEEPQRYTRVDVDHRGGLKSYMAMSDDERIEDEIRRMEAAVKDVLGPRT